MELKQLKNLGPASQKMLQRAGITEVEQLEALGPVAAYLRVKASTPTSLNLLYALYGALNDCHWTDIPANDKQDMLMAIDAATDIASKIDHH